MALKIVLKADEKIIIGGAVLRGGKHRTEFIIENNVPILRDRDIMREEDAKSYCSKIYFVTQLMYIDEKNIVEYYTMYWKLVGDLVKSVPSTTGLIAQISEHIANRAYYKAIKSAKKLIEYEQEVLKRAEKSA